MKKIIYIPIVLLLFSCASKNSVTTKKPLYEMLSIQNDGGATIRFYEILTEPEEIVMLLSDPNLKKKIKQDDIKKCNFLILNMGSQPKGNYKFVIENIEETDSNITITINEVKPIYDDRNLSEVFYPYSIVKINSKKPIIFK
jgi:hypothetical protein